MQLFINCYQKEGETNLREAILPSDAIQRQQQTHSWKRDMNTSRRKEMCIQNMTTKIYLQHYPTLTDLILSTYYPQLKFIYQCESLNSSLLKKGQNVNMYHCYTLTQKSIQ